MEGNHANARGHIRALKVAFWTVLGLWSCCGLSLQRPDAAKGDSSRPPAPPRWGGNFFEDEGYYIYAVRITPKLLPDRLNEDVIVAIGITSDELVRLLGWPHEVAFENTARTRFSFVYCTTVDAYVFDFRRVQGNKEVLYAISAYGGY
jgi:hypothetical protein